MYIPDLFGAYVKGRELAIEKNWQDLRNFEAIEQARNQNDLSAMDVWERRQQMPGKMSMFYNQAKSSDMAMELMNVAQRGRLAQTHMQSDHAVNNYGIYKAYEPTLVQNMGNLFGTKVDEIGLTAGFNRARNAELTPNITQMGTWQGQNTYNQAKANNIVGKSLPTTAEQQVSISTANGDNAIAAAGLTGLRLATAIDQHPTVAKVTEAELKRALNLFETPTTATPAGADIALIASLVERARHEGPEGGAAYHLMRLGYDIKGNPLSQVVQQGLPAGTTPNGMSPQQFDAVRSAANAGSTATTATTTTTANTTAPVNPFASRPAVAYPLLSLGFSPNGRVSRPAAAYPQGMTPNGMPIQQFRAIGNTMGTSLMPSSNPNSATNLAYSVGSSYLPAWQVVP